MTETTPNPSDAVKLLAFDEEDLSVVSATFQDAIVRVADMAYLPAEKRFALIAARFDWIAAAHGQAQRCWTGLHFDHVTKVAQIEVAQDKPDALLNLLAIRFLPADPPSGAIVLTFSGGAAVRLEVECIEAQMRDTGPRWATKALPGHPIDAMAGDLAAGPAGGETD
jgi:hypothetical protein